MPDPATATAPAPYPASDLDRREALLGLLGTFWSRTYAAGAELAAQLDGLGALYRQAQRDLDEAVASVALATVPLRHVEEWQPVTLSEQATRAGARPRAFAPAARAAAFGAGGAFGDPVVPPQYPIPLAPASDCAALCDAIAAPRWFRTAGVDFEVDAGGVAWLAEDPFDDPALAPEPAFDASGAAVDRTLTLWAHAATSDRRTLAARAGDALGLDLPSTGNARALAVTLLGALVRGTSDLAIRRIFAACCDAPLCGSDGEVVAAVFRDADGLVVATDRAVYRGPAAANPAVAAGDVLAAGDPLTDALRFDDLHAGAAPAGCDALATPPAWLGGGYAAGLPWPAAAAPLSARPAVPGADPDAVGPAPPGYAGPLAASWPLGAAETPGARRFWDEAYARAAAGVAPALAAGLDPRPAPATPTRAEYLPAAVAPLALLAAGVLRGPTLVVRVAAASTGPDRLDGLLAPALRMALPPHTLLLVRLEMPPLAEDGAPGMADGPGAAAGDAMPALIEPADFFTPPANDRLAAIPAPAWSA